MEKRRRTNDDLNECHASIVAEFIAIEIIALADVRSFIPSHVHPFAKDAIKSFTNPNILSSRTSSGEILCEDPGCAERRTLAINGDGRPVKVCLDKECKVFCTSLVK